MADIFDRLAAKTPTNSGDIFDKLAAASAVPAGTPGGVLPGVPGAPTPANMQAGPNWGSSVGDVARTVGSHAANLVRGPFNAITAPPQGTTEKAASLSPGALAAYRMLVKPSIAPAQQAISQARQGNYSGAARSAESAIPVVGPWADQVESDVANRGGVAGMAGLATDVLAPKAAGAAIGKLPDAARQSAVGIINRTIGARKADFARGANPGQGYIDNNLGPAASMESIADKAAAARQEVGSALGDTYTQATQSGKLIPADTIRQAIHPIIDEAKRKAGAPGVAADPQVYSDLKNSFEPTLQAADAKGGMTPNELWDLRKDINDSLNWGDQSRLNLTRTQQRVSGALGSVLKDAVPESEEMNQHYQDLVKLENRAQERANTHSSPLTGLAVKGAMSGAGALLGHGTPLGAAGGAAAGAVLDSVPVKTTLASGLNAGGNALRPIASAAPSLALTDTLGAVSSKNKPSAVGNSQAQGNEEESAGEVNQDADSLSQPTPDTHDFSLSGWTAANPDGDPDAAKDSATQQGYAVVN